MAGVSIRPTKNGPYIVEGPVDIFDTEGNKILVDKPRIAPIVVEPHQTSPSATAPTAPSVFRPPNQ